eukprot:jgi/Hompol1/6855/HPOL_000365-RA
MGDSAAIVVPPELQFVASFVQRAQELKMREPIVAYYCNFYAAKLAIEKGVTSKESQTFLLSLMDTLEQDKVQLSGNEAISNDVVGYAHVENFALRIFLNADNEDRAGHASKKTAKTFLAASIFLELLKNFGEIDQEDKVQLSGNEAISNDVVGYAHVENFALRIFLNADNEDRAGHASKKTAKTFLAASIFLELLKNFGEIDQETQQKIRYAKFKAADIMKAIKEGRTPVPGPPGGDPADNTADQLNSLALSGGSADASVSMPASATTSGIPADLHFQPSQSGSSGHPTLHDAPQGQFGLPPPVAPPIFAQPPAFPQHSTPTAAFVPTMQPSAPSAPTVAHTPSYEQASFNEDLHKMLTQAQKHSKFAISAMQYEDIPTAVDNLQKALALLVPYMGK